MTRNDDLRKNVGKREKRGSLRRTIWTRRARTTVLSVALGFASLSFLPYEFGGEPVFAVSTVASSPLQAAQAAASKSLYSQRQQQALQEAQRQAAAQEQARIQAENRARAQRQAQAAQAQAQAQARQAAQAESSKKSFLSDLFKREPIESNSNSYGAAGTFNDYERAQFASKGGLFPQNDGNAGKFGLGASLFKRSDPPQRPRQEASMDQARNAAQYARSNASAGRAPSARVGAPSSAVLAQASSSPNDSRDALAKVPWDLMPQQTRERLSQLASSPTLYRRLPMSGGSCNPEIFDFFLTYPNAVVELWRVSGYDGVTMTSEGNGAYSIAEKGGSSGRIQIIYQDSELTLVHCYGSYVSPVFPRPLEGEAFLILQTRYTEDASKTPLVVCRMDAFVGIKNMGADLLARTFSSVVGKVADSNFESTLGFVCGVSRSIEESPQEFQQVVASLRLDPNAKNILLTKTQEAANQAQARRRGQTVEYRLLAKANAPQPGYARILARGDANKALPDGRSSLARTPGVAKSSPSYGKTIEFNMSKSSNIASNEFALASDADFENSLDWGDDERMATGEEVLAARSPDSATSVAKIGAKTAKNSSVIGLLEEQEENDKPVYQYDEVVSTDSDESSDGALLADDETTSAAALTDDALILDDSGIEEEANDVAEDSGELTMTLDFDAAPDLKDSPVAIPYSAQTNIEDETESEVAENELVAMPALELPSEEENASEDEDLLTTLPLPDELQESDATSEDAPVVPLPATTKNPSSARAKGLNAMKRATKKEAPSAEPAVMSALPETPTEETKDEEKTDEASEKTSNEVKMEDKAVDSSETVAKDADESGGFKPVKQVEQARDKDVASDVSNADADFEAVAQEMESKWTPVREGDSRRAETTSDEVKNGGESTRLNDGFQAVIVEDEKVETPQKSEEKTAPIFAPIRASRNAASESDEETGPVKRFVTRRFTPRTSSEGNKPIPSFRSVLKGDAEDGAEEQPSFKPIERLKNVVNPNNSN